MDTHPQYIDVDKPNWHEYFLDIAKVVSTRSIDAQTKHGCVITTKDHRIIGTGYNSFISDIDDRKLPNVRPNKYKWMLHSEENAISNCIISPHLFKDGVNAYITGRPCRHCLMLMVQNNINEIYTSSKYGWAFDDNEYDDFIFIIMQKNIHYECKKLKEDRYEKN